jgi:hypothetical protein
LRSAIARKYEWMPPAVKIGGRLFWKKKETDAFIKKKGIRPPAPKRVGTRKFT